ncbi:MAG: hypothetical protein Q8S73_14760 [Deltaproteobacteria bacterium]|nr:hypothetical protein [Myxococcales bacterium]MDP3215366.1 hypothetical protein [Deltaproteobacteria bacterium]
MSAAVFAVLAVAPPLGTRPTSVHRLESLGDPTPGRPWLLRALRTGDASPSTGLRVTSPDARVESLATLAGRGEWLRVQVPADRTALRLRVADVTGVHPLRVPVAAGPSAVVAPPIDSRALVLEGVLVPELEGEVIVRPTDGPVELLGVTEQVVVEPARAALDACGLALFRVRVSGLGAPVSLVSASHRDELRLPLVGGGIAVRDDGDSVLLRATSPGATAHLVGGDRAGPTWWSAVTLGAEADEGRARVAVPPATLWVEASHSADLSEPVSPLLRPASPPCLATPLGQRMARGRLAPPELPPVRVRWDGPAEGARLVAARSQRMTALCVLGVAVSVALEAALLLGAGLGRGPAALKPFAGDGRTRLGVLVAGISTLLLMGAAMVLAVQLRSP